LHGRTVAAALRHAYAKSTAARRGLFSDEAVIAGLGKLAAHYNDAQA
jgi:hypothetical protein